MRTKVPDAGRARYVLLLVGLLGECTFGGVIWGWTAVTGVLQDLGYYTGGCTDDELDGGHREGIAGGGSKCKSQDTKLAIVWIVGTLAANFAPAVAGPALDVLGPRIVAVVGALLSWMGFVLMGARFAAPARNSDRQRTGSLGMCHMCCVSEHHFGAYSCCK
jgi:hypothetical protein